MNDKQMFDDLREYSPDSTIEYQRFMDLVDSIESRLDKAEREAEGLNERLRTAWADDRAGIYARAESRIALLQDVVEAARSLVADYDTFPRGIVGSEPFDALRSALAELDEGTP